MEKTGKIEIMFAKYFGKPKGKRQRRRLGLRGNYNIRMDVKGIGFGERTECCDLR